ncbi:class I SAM-dependent methyltransferase [Neolewinella litorea]|nr:class I SAM-dependent methyltransferase [Neolewinella litorea]
MTSFNLHKQKFKTAFRQILSEGDSYEIGEAALPAYAHPNPLIDWLFWERIRVAYDFAGSREGGQNVLDFGCGSGVLSYLLAQDGCSVTACDVNFGPLDVVREKVAFPSSIEFVEGDILAGGLKEGSFDVIFALDVLEHISDLDPYVVEFRRLLKPDGVVVVSGPTENLFYKIGRRLAGNRFTGDYHVTNIAHVKAAFEREMRVTILKKLLFPVVLFEVFIARPE